MGRPSKLNARQWTEVEHRIANHESIRRVAAEFGISPSAILGRRKTIAEYKEQIKAGRGIVKLPVAVQNLERVAGFIYVIYLDAPGERFYKIGRATSFDERVAAHQTSSPYAVNVALGYFVGDAVAEEGALHAIFAGCRVRGEWFALTHDDLATIAARAVLV